MYILKTHILNRIILVFKHNDKIAHIRIIIRTTFPQNLPNMSHIMSSIFLFGFFLKKTFIILINITVGIKPIIGPTHDAAPPISAKYIP